MDSADYDRIVKSMQEANKKAGYKKYRSVAHFVTEAVMDFIKDDKK